MEKSICILAFGAKIWILILKSTYFSTWPNYWTLFSLSFTAIIESFFKVNYGLICRFRTRDE
jgi:hypothetical protein